MVLIIFAFFILFTVCFAFWTWPFLKSLQNLLQYYFFFMWFVLFCFGCKAWGSQLLNQDQTLTPALEGKVLTDGLPAKSLLQFLT